MRKPVLLGAAAILLAALAVRYQWSGGAIFSEIANSIKSYYLSLVESVDRMTEIYFEQADAIERLQEENARLKESEEVLSAFAAEVVNLSKLKGYAAPPNYRVVTVRALSYADLPDMQKIIVDYDGLRPNEVKGLIYNNMTAGIVVQSIGSYSKALLNGDRDCSYAVYIGDRKAPGVAMGKSEREMVVRYIPAWMTINVGDEVVTNGLDGIFFAGVKVGTVTKVDRLSAYIEATIKPHYSSFNPDYFYLVESADGI